MTNLPPCRGLWAFTADSMILLGENYIANIPHYPTLQSMQYFPNYSFEKIIFTAKDTGFIIGRNTITNRGLILRTTDGGRTWKEQQLISCPPINDIVAITSRTLLAACNEGVLLRTETAGSNPAGIEPGQQSIYASVYPNPIKQGSVNISIPGQTFAYEVYTTLGQLLASGTGNGDQKINCESWPAGIYYITLLIEDQLVSKKIQILK